MATKEQYELKLETDINLFEPDSSANYIYSIVTVTLVQKGMNEINKERERERSHTLHEVGSFHNPHSQL